VLTPEHLGFRLRFGAGGGFGLEQASDFERLQVQTLELCPQLRHSLLGFVQPSLQFGTLIGLRSCAASTSHPG
jgi:hypothetical protein